MKKRKEMIDELENEVDVETEYDEDRDFEDEENDDFDEDFDEESDSDEDDTYVDLAPSTPLAYIRFMRNKENKVYSMATMPKVFKSKILKHILLAALTLGLGIAMLIVYQSPIPMIVSGIVVVVLGLLAVRLYLIGSRKQYVQFKGIVVRSDYTKNVLEKAKNSLSKTVKADFRYNSFVVKTEDEYVRVNCNNPKELPQEGDAVKVTIPGNSKVYEEEGLTTITTYIDIERIA